MTIQTSWSERSLSIDPGDDRFQSLRNTTKQNGWAQRLSCYLMPNSKFRLIWELFIFVVIWYNSVMTPLRLFILKERTPKALISADVALDIIFVVDTLLHFFRPYIDKDTGQVVTNLKKIRSKYAASMAFYMNVLACIPILKTPLAPLLNDETNVALSTNFNILRMIRILHFPEQFEELKSFLSRKVPVNESSFRMGIILFFTQLLMCMFASVYFGLSSTKVDDMCPGPDKFAETVLEEEMWIAMDELIVNTMDPQICNTTESDYMECKDCPQFLFFLRSVYFLMQTLFTIGYGDSVVPSRSVIEVSMACVFMIFGVFGYGLIIANMTSVLSNIDVVRMRFRHEMDNLNRWLSFRVVPESLRQRVEMLFSYIERSQHGMLDENLFEGLPSQLRREMNESNLALLEKVPFFDPEFRSKEFVSLAALALVRRIYPPSCYVLYEGEKQRELIIVKSGRLELRLASTTDVVSTLVEGDFIGDYQLLFGTVNQIGVFSPGFAEVLALSFDALENLMDHPSQRHIEFRAIGGNLRKSTDPGACRTLELAKLKLAKIESKVSKVTSQKSNKLKHMMDTDEVKTMGFRILPQSKIRVFWDVFAITAIMFEAISIAIYLAVFFKSSTLKSAHPLLFLIFYAIDLTFIADMYLRLNIYTFTSFDGGRSETVFDRYLIRKHYLNSAWFQVDRVAVIPFDLISLAVGYHTLWRLLKFVRVYQLPQYIRRFRSNLEICFDHSMTETACSGMVMFMYSILIVVWSSVGWNALRMDEDAYKAPYWALTTLTTVGYGDFTPNTSTETLYAVIVGVIGATFTAGIIANVSSFFHDVDVSEDNIEHKVHCAMRFLDNHSRPHDEVKKLQEYFDYIVREQDGINEELLLRKSIPAHLKSNLLIHLTHSMIEKCSFFSNCEAGFLRKIMISLDQRFFGSQSMILTDSIPSDGMYFIKKGKVDLMKKMKNGDLTRIRRLKVDGFFAEECLLEHWDENPYLAIAAADSELWYLSRKVFNRVVEDFPHVRVQLTKVAMEPKVSDRRGSIQAITKAVENIKRQSSWFLHPEHILVQAWFGVVFLLILYNAFILPYRFAFMENHEISWSWVTLDYITDFLLILDVIIRAQFLAFYDDNHLIFDRKKIFRKYFKSELFKWHILSVLPIEVFFLGVEICPFWKLQVWSMFRLNKLFRLVEVPTLLNGIEKTLAKAGIRVPHNLIRVAKLVMVILLSAHFTSCIFFTLANCNQHSSASETHNWANDQDLFTDSSVCPGEPIASSDAFQRYVASLYWSMATLTTVGYGDITANEDSIVEIIFATIILVIGTAIYTLVIALLEDIVSQLDVTSSLYKLRTDKVASYCELESIPDVLKSKINAYYDNLWHRQLGASGQKVMSYFPTSYCTEMLLDMLSPLLHQTFFIKDCTPDFVAGILGCLKYELCLPEDRIFHEGEKCNSLVLLFKGEVDLMTSSGVKFKTVNNCILGEAAFFGFEPHICTAKASDSCEVFTLSMDAFATCIHEHHLSEQYAEYLEGNEDILHKSKYTIEKMMKNLNSTKMGKMLEKEEKLSLPKGVISPDNFGRQIWESLLFGITLYFMFTIPYDCSFLSTHVGTSRFLVDTFMDFAFILDIYARLNKFAIMKEGFLLFERRKFRGVYLRQDFGGDILSTLPLSFFAYLFGHRSRSYGLFRICQLLRIRHFGRYLNNFIEIVNTRTKYTISTAQLRIVQIFFIVLFLCHWFAAIFHALGYNMRDDSWLSFDGSLEKADGDRYLRSFYWALYTVTTIGYGSVPVVTNGERFFAMLTMIVGAIICDAGVTAILTSIISVRDQQSGTNNRRIQCTRRYMTSNTTSEETRERVLDYYRYDDRELQNINEEDILNDFSTSLRNEVVHHFCFDSFRSSDLCSDLNDGAIITLMNRMSPYLAVPNEHLCIQGENCDFLYILKRGQITCTDSVGCRTLLPAGSIIGHLETDANLKMQGLPNRAIDIHIVGGKGFKAKFGNPFITFKFENTQRNSSIKKDKDWSERILLKTGGSNQNILEIEVSSWQSGQKHLLIGTAAILTKKDKMEDAQQVVIKDSNGKSAGILKLVISSRPLQANEKVSSLHCTVTTIGYCHLYRLRVCEVKDLLEFLEISKEEKLCKRLRGAFLEHTLPKGKEKDRIKFSWRRPSRPSTYHVARREASLKVKKTKWTKKVAPETQPKARFSSLVRTKTLRESPFSEEESSLSEHDRSWDGIKYQRRGTVFKEWTSS